MIKTLTNCCCKITNTLEKFGAPLWDLAARLYLFYVFFLSGWLKLQDLLNGNWSRVVLLYREEFKLPMPEVMAWLSLGSELIFPLLLLIGFISRLSAFAILIMALIIELTYLNHISHILWIFLSASLFLKGAGALSIDCFLCCKTNKGKKRK